jgi:hypothetical protein
MVYEETSYKNNYGSTLTFQSLRDLSALKLHSRACLVLPVNHIY